MKSIKQFLDKHPLISVSGLEKQLSIPAGTVRVNSDRKIPKKYLIPLIEALRVYGFTATSYLPEGIYTVTNKDKITYKCYMSEMIPVVIIEEED